MFVGMSEVVRARQGAEAAGQGRWTLRGTLTLRGQTRPVTVHVMLKNGQYTGETTVKQTDFGITPPEKRASEPRTKSELSSTFGWRGSCENLPYY
jgi:polyisoprenoid-binding protein YceI